ncbi:phosphoribosyltransferase family protein [Massilia sp. PAMC28688]|uniref:phosphoribosyltransferase domain-containing protein n=1 Tax=Massilia sp. PAMC28688 TaxID=2861283 RepID=UPI001C6254D6|nr:phosphoribosyltransferase domain-containing protein [Massilia sp. PAMC28688]QYF94827.1 phosphoribosyltransferase family protein [Massilia sp. PAMC28688]
MNNPAIIELPTGRLELTITDSQYPSDELLGFAARANAKRGFLFLSKVLGKHWPVKPSLMREIHTRIAASVPEVAGPVVFIAMAETAVGLGQGVFEAWLLANPGREALFIHTTRYHVGGVDTIEFEEAHSHAPRQFLHMPPDAHKKELLLRAKTLVMVDDEASTGNTFLNLSHAVRSLNPGVERVHLAAIANFMGKEATAALSQRFGVPVTMSAPLNGEYQFIAGEAPTEGPPAQRFDATADRGASSAFGRFGMERAMAIPEGLAARLAEQVPAGDKVLVLGTGEFMHASFLLGAQLEQRGLDVKVQSTTRSPILKWGAVSEALAFQDNYGEGVTNFLYNVSPDQYDHVFICHETAPNQALSDLADVFDARLLHFITETHVEEVSEIPVR